MNHQIPSSAGPRSTRALLLAAAGGAALAALALPHWLPALSASLSGPEPKAAWFLARASGLVAYVLVWLTTLLGLLISNRLARLWPGGPLAFDLHQHTSLLGIVMALFHALVLLGDRYIGFSLRQIAVPFTDGAYRPLWVGLGRAGFYLLALVGLSFYVRQQIGARAWRLIHGLSFAVFALALLHGLQSGSDSAAPGVRLLYWAGGASVLLLTCARVLGLLLRSGARPQPADGPPALSAASGGESAAEELRGRPSVRVG